MKIITSKNLKYVLRKTDPKDATKIRSIAEQCATLLDNDYKNLLLNLNVTKIAKECPTNTTMYEIRTNVANEIAIIFTQKQGLSLNLDEAISFYNTTRHNLWKLYTAQHITDKKKKKIINENEWERKLRQVENAGLQALAQEFAQQLLKDKELLDLNQEVSECAKYAPGRKSVYDKKYNIAHIISRIIYPPKSEDKVDTTHTNIRYSKLLSSLRAKYNAQELAIKNAEIEKKNYKKNLFMSQKREFCTMKNKPMSTSITDPTPMPVLIAEKEDLTDFFNHLASNKPVISDDKVQFVRGVHYNDGRIDLCKQVVGNLWIQDLMNSIKNNPHVKHFLLGNNIINIEGATAIANFITEPHVPQIKTWYLAGNQINSQGIELIAKALTTDAIANALWLKRNPIKEGAKYLGDMLKQNTTLRILDLDNTGLLDSGVKDLFEGLKHNTTLKHLYLSSNGITEEGCKYIAEYFDYKVLASEKGLESLWLTINRIGDAGTEILMNSLKNYKHLKRLNLGSNRITHVGAKHVFETYLDSTNLIMLDLGYYKSTLDLGEMPNNLGSEGCDYAIQFLNGNKSVQYFSIMNNYLSVEDLDKLSCVDNDTILLLAMEQHGLKASNDAALRLRNRLSANIKRVYDMEYNEFIKNPIRFLKHTKKVQYIDSVYRNKM